eukprot:2663230-Rhodomonas_salina.1
MDYCMDWNRPDILSRVITHSRVPNTAPQFKAKLNEAVHRALHEDRVAALKVVLVLDFGVPDSRGHRGHTGCARL